MISRTAEYYRDLIWEFTKNELKLRYSGSFLGFLWVFLKPFSMFIIILVAFSYFFGQSDPHYKFNLLVGLIIFSYFSEGTTNMANALLNRADIILKLNFPRIIVILSSLLASLLNFLASLGLLFIIWLVYSPQTFQSLTLNGLGLFILMILSLSFLIAGFGFFASIIQVRLRDFQNIWALALQAMMYLTPIIYPLSILSEKLRNLFMFNPLTIAIETSRNGLLNLPIGVPVSFLITFIAFSVLSSIFGYFYFNNEAKKIAEYL